MGREKARAARRRYAPPPPSTQSDELHGDAAQFTEIAVQGVAFLGEHDAGERAGQHDVPGFEGNTVGAELVGEPGHIVLAGSFTRVVFAQKGDTIHADYGPLGGIAIQFV